MHKSRKGSNRRGHKKGYKLRLSKQEAAERSVKGWITKHQKYKYGSLHLPHGVHHADIPSDEELRANMQKDAAEGEHILSDVDLAEERLQAIRGAHEAPRRLLRKAVQDLGRGSVRDAEIATFIAKANKQREAEMRQAVEQMDPLGLHGYDYAISEVTGRRDPVGNILGPLFKHINANPNKVRIPAPSGELEPGQGADKMRHGETTKNVVENSFRRRDPLTNEPFEVVTPEQKAELVQAINESRSSKYADDRNVQAEHAKRLARRMAMDTAKEEDRRALVARAKVLDRQAAVEADPSLRVTHRTPDQIRKDLRKAEMSYSKTMKKTKTTKLYDSDPVTGEITEIGAHQQPLPSELKTRKVMAAEVKRLNAELEAALNTEKFEQQAGAKRKADVLKEARLDYSSSPLTTDEYYEIYGHEGKVPPTGSIAASEGKLTAQGKFMKVQNERRLKGLKTGNIVMAWDDNLKRTGDVNNALLAVAPNKQWRYRLNRSPDWIAQHNTDETGHGPNLWPLDDVDIIKKGANVHEIVKALEDPYKNLPRRIKKKARTDPTTAVRMTEQRATKLQKKLDDFRKAVRAREDFSSEDRKRVLDAAERAFTQHEKVLDYSDTETRFHRGKRDWKGDVVPGDWEEVDNYRLEQKFKSPVNVTLGERHDPTVKKDDKVDKDIFVSIPGLKKKSTKDMLYSSDTQGTERLIQLGGRWYPASQADWELRRGTRTETGSERARRSGATRWSEDRFNKHNRIHFVNPSDLKLKGKERDKLSVVIPKVKVGNIEFGERAVTLGLDENSDRRRAANNAIFGYSRAKKYHDLVQESQEASRAEDVKRGLRAQVVLAGLKRGDSAYTQHRDELAEQQGITKDEAERKMETRLKSLVVAGSAASVYGIKKRVKFGYAPQWANNAIESFRKDHRGVDDFLTKNNARFFSVNEAYVRPAAEKAANFGFMLRHPLSDPDGSTMGVEWGRWRYRDYWIPEHKRLERVLERRGNEIDRIQRTRTWFEDNAYSDSWLKQKLVSRRDNVLRSKDYKDFTNQDGLLSKALHETREIRAKAPGGSPLEASANRLAAKIQQIRSLGGNSEKMNTRVTSWTGSTELAAPVGKRFKPEFNLLSGEYQNVLSDAIPKSLVSNAAEFAVRHKTFLIGAGVAAAALGTAYGIHKYRESKKPESERRAFYNKILPPAFTVKTPHLRGTGYVRWGNNTFTRELGVAGDRFPIPVRYGLSLKEHRIAFRPMDHGYAPNVPLIGGLKLRGPSPGGSLYNSVLENPEAKYHGNAKRSFQVKGKQVVLGGKKIPVFADIEDRKKIQLSRTNPNRLTQEDRENLVWAYKDTQWENEVRNFYRQGKTDYRLQDLFDDDKEVSRIRRKKGTGEVKKLEDQLAAFRKSQRTERMSETSGADAGDSIDEAFAIGAGQRGSDAWWANKKARMEKTGIEWR